MTEDGGGVSVSDRLSIRASRRQGIGDEVCSDWFDSNQNVWIGSGPNVIVRPMLRVTNANKCL